MVSGDLDNGPATQHLSANHLITIDADRAHAAIGMYAWHQPSGEPDDIGTLRGTYDVDLVRTTAGWRITRLVMTALWAKPDRAVIL